MAEAAAAAVAGGTLFNYNRKNFMYDRLQRLKLELQMMEFRVNKQDMFREDVSDICGLTSVKMDTYLIVNAIQIGFCIIALCEGRMQPGTPSWLVGAHLISLVCAFAFLLLSVWFAMHATIAAKAYEVRLLTQFVRLPIPSWSQLEAARTYGSQYEKVESRQMFRVPFLCGAQEQVSTGGCLPLPASRSSSDSQRPNSTIGFPASSENSSVDDVKNAADPWGFERCGDTIYELNASLQTDPRKLRHIQLVREAMQYWQGSDAFARVSMSVGTSLFAVALAYYVLGYVMVYSHGVVGAWLIVILFLACAWALLRIDMSLTGNEYIIATMLQIGPPLAMAMCVTLWEMDACPYLIQCLMPFIYFAHAAWLMYLTTLCKVVEQRNGAMVPTGFKAVLYIDVFGWIKRGVTANTTPSKFHQRRPDSEDLAEVSGKGPAVQTIRYENGKPFPVRPEQQLQDASLEPDPSAMTRVDLAPSTFVPPHEDDSGERHWMPGLFGGRPWYVFSMTKMAFACLWVLSGFIVGWELWSSHPQVGLVRPAHSSSSLLEFEEEPLSTLVGNPVTTDWPQENVQPLSLSCDSSHQTMIASGRHRIYTANFDGLASKDRITFSNSPVCAEVEGDAIQDASIQCSSEHSRSACRALVLHEKGKRLTSCSLKQNSTGVGISASIGGNWLQGHDSKHEAPREKIQAFVMPVDMGDASVNEKTAYIATSGQRLVKMQQTLSKEGSASWFPRRVLGKSPTIPSGGMDVLNNRFLVLLLNDGRRLAAHDLQNGGLRVGSWRLPGADRSWIPQAQAWTAMCATGDDLYLLAKGPSPSIWRFPLPEQLRLPPAAETH